MPVLTFPADRIVGTLSWPGSWLPERGPVLAQGAVDVPDGVPVDLEVSGVTSSVRHGDSWHLDGAQTPIDLAFIEALPQDVVTALTLRDVTRSSCAALPHLAPGLQRLQLMWSDLDDSVLPHVAQLRRLTMLQTFGNAFTDAGVQVLAALASLERLYLEEETLTAAAFGFVARLPRLQQLGLQDVPITDAELATLRGRLPGVSVVR